jgi:hypothetical protein
MRLNYIFQITMDSFCFAPATKRGAQPAQGKGDLAGNTDKTPGFARSQNQTPMAGTRDRAGEAARRIIHSP